MSARTIPLAYLVGATEIATIFGVRPSAVSNWRKRHAGNFPEPVLVLACGPIWDVREVWRWDDERFKV